MSPGRYAIWALAVIVGIAALTCWPILVNPQLEPDDYRYLRLADDVLAGRMPFADAVVVENGWDHLWFPATDAIVRFFRPTVVSSVLVEALLTNGTGGSLLTNVGLHVGSALLVAWLALRL
ncbi:MAG: hypothetical protein KDC98_17415, partial [Planctomycetes bacterium]|nr:hypothetical protein [Planctomycetota bacterium]